MGNKLEKEIQNDHLILIVEDEYINLLYLEEILKGLNLRYISVENGKDAIAAVKSKTEIDLVLMDIKLPGMNGYEATKEIKKIRKDIPVIAQTAYAMVSDRRKALEAGCDDYISKPIDQEQFTALLEKYLKK